MARSIQCAFANAAFISLIAFQPTPGAAQTQRQQSWCSIKDDTFSADRRIEGCTAAIQAGIQSGENLSWAYYNRGIAYAKKGQYERAIVDFDEALKFDPDSIFTLNNRGAAYARKGQYDRAIADFDRSIRLNPGHAITFNNRGIAYAKKGEYELAIADFERAIRLEPNDPSAQSNRKLVEELKGKAVVANEEALQGLKGVGLQEKLRGTLPAGAQSLAAAPPAAVTPPSAGPSQRASAPASRAQAEPSQASVKDILPPTAPNVRAPAESAKLNAPESAPNNVIVPDNRAPAEQLRGSLPDSPANGTARQREREPARQVKSLTRMKHVSASRSRSTDGYRSERRKHVAMRSHKPRQQSAVVRFFKQTGRKIRNAIRTVQRKIF